MADVKSILENLVEPAALSEAIASMKTYAGYYTGKNKKLNELLAVEEWIYVNFGDAPPFTPLDASGLNSDPPDCIAIHEDGGKWGFEVTELVHEETRKLAQLLPQHPAFEPAPPPHKYSREEFIATVSTILARKNSPPAQWKGGPYTKRVLVITNDEDIDLGVAAGWLWERVFAKPSGIDDAFLLAPPPPNAVGDPDGISLRLILS